MKIIITGIFLFILFKPCELSAQNDLTEEWEMQYLNRQPSDKLMAAIGVKQGMVIGEVGAWRGRFTVYMAREVGPPGKIYSNDIDRIFDQTHPTLSSQTDSSSQLSDSLVKVEKLNDKTILIRMGYDAVTAISTQKGIVVIDAGISGRLAVKYRKIIENEFPLNDIGYLINTHGHPDHTGGNSAFADAVIIGHENCINEISNQWKDPERVKSSLNKTVNDYDKELNRLVPGTNAWIDVFCQKIRYQSAYNDALKNVAVIKPNVTFNDCLNIDMGDIKFDLIYFGKAHSESDIIIHIPEMKILMVGDLFSQYGRPGFHADNGKIGERWIKVTVWIEKRWSDIGIVINGHGQIMSKEDLQSFISNIKKLQNRNSD
jgi:glyoxylase-like metal-dependent hydrolase (beta-lactamase superfamily II)